MKVVLFCGGHGLRIRDAENVPKPLVQIGYRPVIWHVMKYYAHHGHTDFILCLGYGADQIKKYFLEYSECVSNDFVLSCGGKKVELYNSDIHDWRITFRRYGIRFKYRTKAQSLSKDIWTAKRCSSPITATVLRISRFPAQLEDFHRQKKIASFLVRASRT